MSLLENLKQITSGGSDLRDLKAKRTAAGFNPEGEMQPLIIKTEAELSQQQEVVIIFKLTYYNQLKLKTYLRLVSGIHR